MAYFIKPDNEQYEYALTLPGVNNTRYGARVPNAYGPLFNLPGPTWDYSKIVPYYAMLPKSLKESLYPYQRVGIARGLTEKRIMLRYDGGRGKTRTALAIAMTLNTCFKMPCIVMCRAYLRYNFAEEIFVTWPGAKVQHLTNGATWNPDYIGMLPHMTSGSFVKSIREGTQEMPKSYVLIIDESHRPLSCPDAFSFRLEDGHWVSKERLNKSKLLHFSLATWELCKRASYKVFLTATPVFTETLDLYGQMRALEATPEIPDGEWGQTATKFKLAFCKYIKIPGRNYLVPPPLSVRKDIPLDLETRLKTCWHNVNSNDYGVELPAITRKIINIPWDSSFNVNERVQLPFEGTINRDATLASLRKTEEVIRLCALHRKILVFTGEHFVANSLADSLSRTDELIDYQIFNAHGGNSTDKGRHKLFNEFRQTPGKAVFVTTSYALGEGANGQFCDALIWARTPTEPGELRQGDWRIDRLGLKHPATIYYLIALGTGDENRKLTLLSRLPATESYDGSQSSSCLLDLENEEKLKEFYDMCSLED